MKKLSAKTKKGGKSIGVEPSVDGEYVEPVVTADQKKKILQVIFPVLLLFHTKNNLLRRHNQRVPRQSGNLRSKLSPRLRKRKKAKSRLKRPIRTTKSPKSRRKMAKWLGRLIQTMIRMETLILTPIQK